MKSTDFLSLSSLIVSNVEACQVRLECQGI
jgi:hypothetical protein